MPTAALLRMCLRIVRVARTIVPAAARERWVAEWSAEIHHYCQRHDERGHLSASRAATLLGRVAGATSHAFVLRVRSLTLHELTADCRLAARMFVQQPGTAAAAVAALALGIGANTAIFSVARSVLLRPLPYPQADRLAVLFGTFDQEGPAGRHSVALA